MKNLKVFKTNRNGDDCCFKCGKLLNECTVIGEVDDEYNWCMLCDNCWDQVKHNDIVDIYDKYETSPY